MAANYVPEAGAIVWLQFEPQAGHERAGHRPAVVLSPASVLADRVKSQDHARRAPRKGRVSPGELFEVRAKLKALIG